MAIHWRPVKNSLRGTTCSLHSFFLISEVHLFSTFSPVISEVHMLSAFFLLDLRRSPVLLVLSSWSRKITCSPRPFFLISGDHLFSASLLLDHWRSQDHMIFGALSPWPRRVSGPLPTSPAMTPPDLHRHFFPVIPQKVTWPLVSPSPLFLSRYTESSGAEGDIVRPRAGKYLYCSILEEAWRKISLLIYEYVTASPNIRICHGYFSS